LYGISPNGSNMASSAVSGPCGNRHSNVQVVESRPIGYRAIAPRKIDRVIRMLAKAIAI
jgi:hypothetical protein